MQTKYYMQICIYINMHITSLRNTGFILQQLATKCSVFQLKAEEGYAKFGNIMCNVFPYFLHLTSTYFSGF